MIHQQRYKLKSKQKISNCTFCGSKDIRIEAAHSLTTGRTEYQVACCGYIDAPIRMSRNAAVNAWNATTKEFQDFDRTWLTVDQVYETRWDCMVEPEGVRQVA